MIARSIWPLLAGLGMLALGATPASATPPLALIIDSSGSMAAELDDEPRLDIAPSSSTKSSLGGRS